MAKRGQRKKNRINFDCEEARNELIWLKNYSSNSEKIHQQSINPNFNLTLDYNGELKSKKSRKKEKKIYVYYFWDRYQFYPFENWILNYIRHQCTTYEIVTNKYKKCYSKIKKYCIDKIGKRYSFLRKECAMQKQNKKNKINIHILMQTDIRVAMVCRVVVLQSQLGYKKILINKNNIKKEIENKYNQKIYDKYIHTSIKQGWIVEKKQNGYFGFEVTEKYKNYTG